MTGAWVGPLTTLLDLEVMDKVMVHATKVEAPGEKISVEREE